MASSSGSLPFERVDPPNKRSRPAAFSEAYWTEDSDVLIEHSDPVFEHFELYEKPSGNNYTGRCMHYKVMFKGLKPGPVKPFSNGAFEKKSLALTQFSGSN